MALVVYCTDCGGVVEDGRIGEEHQDCKNK